MRCFSLVGFCISGSVFVAGVVLAQEQAPVTTSRLGSTIEGAHIDDVEDSRRGRRLFGQFWIPDPGPTPYNSTVCFDCHSEPAFGGTTRKPELTVHMVPSDTDPSGWDTYQRLVQVMGAPALQRQPPEGSEARRAIPLFGMGLLEAVSQEDILSRADPLDKNKDGISGRALRIGDGIGRFGWKGAVADIPTFVRTAFKKELGVTTGRTRGQRFSEEDADAVGTYLRLLAAPAPKESPGMEAAKKAFTQVGCSSCHVPQFTTGQQSPVTVLRGRTIEPYTDLLVHDMGPGKPNHEDPKRASKREYRTAPLWGLGRIGGPFWHDGSAATIEDAVRKHEGEGLKSRDAFLKLPKEQQGTILRFLENL